MTDNSFFDEQKTPSLIKTRIVSKYFDCWSKVMINSQKKYPQYGKRIAYIDLFSGPGKYATGVESTPMYILKKAIGDEALCNCLVTLFNDKDRFNAENLKKEIKDLQGVKSLRYQPEVWNEEVGTNIVSEFKKISLVPTLFFVDPWGYKGLSLELINSVIKDWGCDLIFFFNYRRINMGIHNSAVETHMSSIFGEEALNKLKKTTKNQTPSMREALVIEELCNTLRNNNLNYVLPFTFKDENGTRTSHHIIFVSKHFLGYEIMKEIMAKESSDAVDGVASFIYNPIDEERKKQMFLFQFDRPLSALKTDLLETFKGRTLNVKSIYKEHSVGTNYIKKNYKEVLKELSKEGLIKVTKTGGKRPRPNTMADDNIIQFL